MKNNIYLLTVIIYFSYERIWLNKKLYLPTERDILIDMLREYAGGNNYIVYCVFDAYLTTFKKKYIKEEPPITIV